MSSTRLYLNRSNYFIVVFFCLSLVVYSQSSIEKKISLKDHLGNYPSFVFVNGFYFVFSEFSNNSNIDLKLIKLDSDFNLIWEKKIKTEGSDLALRIISDGNDNLYCLSDNSYFINEKNNSSLILKIDLDGNEVWRKSLFFGAGDIKCLYNSLVFTGTNLKNYKLELIKFDWNGNVILEKSFYKSAYKGGSGNLLYDFSLNSLNDSVTYFQGTYYFTDDNKRNIQNDSLPINFLYNPKFKQEYFLLNKKFEIIKNIEIKASQNLWHFILFSENDWAFIVNNKKSNRNNKFFIKYKIENTIDSILIGDSTKMVNFHRVLCVAPYKILVTFNEEGCLKFIFYDLKKIVKDELMLSSPETNYHDCKIIQGNKAVFLYPKILRTEKSTFIDYYFKSIQIKW